MLTLDLYNNTALAGTPRSTTTNEFAINLADPHTSSELYGTVELKRGQQYTFHCEAAGARRPSSSQHPRDLSKSSRRRAAVKWAGAQFR